MNAQALKFQQQKQRMHKRRCCKTSVSSLTIQIAAAVLIAVTIASNNVPSSSSSIFAEARRSSSSSSAAAAARGSSSKRKLKKSSSSANRRISTSSRRSSARRNDAFDDDDDDDNDRFDRRRMNRVEEEEDDDEEEEEMNFGFLDEGHDDEEVEDDDVEEEEPIRARRSGGRTNGGKKKAATARREYYDEDDYDNEDDFDDEEEEDYQPVDRRRRSTPSSSSRRAASSSSSRGRASSNGRGRSSGRRSSGGNVVPYGRGGRRQHRQPQPTAFTRGLAALRESIPDPTSIKDSAMNSISAAKKTTSKLTSNIYREVKGLTSSELEQVMLKATAPNDVPVKGKHVERLVGVTYQISGRYDIYDAVLRKLWSKMVENDWRTTVKALYILHRFSADGAPDHQAALKARLRELRRTRDPKRGKEKYFNSKQLLSGDTNPESIPFRAFLSRYAHYVLLRAQCFGGMFTEIANDPNNAKQSKSSKSKSAAAAARKCITATCLKNEHLEAAQMLLKAGMACELKSNGEEECENTAIALERVVADLIGLTSAVATALNNALKGDYDNNPDMDWDLVQKWCEFYSTDLLVKTKGVMKRTTPTLDAYGLFLPSRIGASVSQDLLQKGLKGHSSEEESSSSNNGDDEEVTKEEVEDEGKEEEIVDEGNDDEEGDMDKDEDVQEDDSMDDEEEEEEDAYDDEYEYEEYDYED